mgnify:CR=1 FL=1
MSRKPENTFIASVHKHLPVGLYSMKNHNQYNAGIADVWYSAKRDWWIEYKFLVLPKRDTTVIDLIGGSAEDVRRVRDEANHLGVSKNIRFHDRVPAKELPLILSGYAFGLSLMEGLKVTDYVECGLTPIIPRIAMYESIFDAQNAVFFEPDSAASLRERLDSLNDIDVPRSVNLDLLGRYSTTNTARKIFELIEECASKQGKKAI